MTEKRQAMETTRRILGELESGVVSGSSGAEYRAKAIYDLADAVRQLIDMHDPPVAPIVDGLPVCPRCDGGHQIVEVDAGFRENSLFIDENGDISAKTGDERFEHD